MELTGLQIATFFVWLLAAVTFILALKFLASPTTARRGNQMGAAGMAIVIAWTFFTVDGMLANWWIVVVAGGIGSVAGVLGARRVPMTAMPQMVAIFNGAGGGAAAVVAIAEFLRDAGKHFTVNYMLAKDSVKNRMETGISYTEFTYMLIQAYDFWHLWKTEKCELQLGGSDQWGNITAGTELISRKEGASAHGLVLPLLTTATGAKFGKSEEGAIYLDPARTSPYRFFQFWVNSDDRDVERWLRYFTFFSMEEIAALVAEQAKDPGKRPAQRRLAEEMTARIHGEAALRNVLEATRADRDRIFNLGYYTWVEQQGVPIDEFEERREPAFWAATRGIVERWDELIGEFNDRVGVSRE